MKWLHLSDIHFNIRGYDSEIVRNKLIDRLKSLKLNIDFILITGDCFYQYYGKENDQLSIVQYIKDIAKACNCPWKNVYICKGNHDVNRNDINRNKLISAVRKKPQLFSSYYSQLSELGDEKFRYIHKAIVGKNYEDYKVIDSKDGYRIISINSCLLSKDKNDIEKLRVCNDKLHEISKKIKNDCKLNILMMHHGIECSALDDARKFEHWIEDNNIDIVHCGHTHRAAVKTYDDIIRDVKQFTAGAIVIDDYAVPSFYFCETVDNKKDIILTLYTYSKKTEQWDLDNQNLRKFKNGKYIYQIVRLQKNFKDDVENNIDSCNFVVSALNQKYEMKFSSKKIYSNKNETEEDFDTWKIIHSLVDVGMPFDRAMKIAYLSIKEVTQESYTNYNNILSAKELQFVVYRKILDYKPESETEFDVSCWASRYARRYSRNTEIRVLKPSNISEKLNYSYIRNSLIKNVMDTVTGNELYYQKIFRKELLRMSNKIMDFLKNMGIFEINDEALKSLIKEYMTQKPHPWLVNENRDALLQYHMSQANSHISDLNEKRGTIVSQTECAYHLCAFLLVQYDSYIGCVETSPINILYFSMDFYDKRRYPPSHPLPMIPYKLIQMKKDLESIGVELSMVKKDITTLYINIVCKKMLLIEKL